jgi:ATP-dependent Lhr-like helicase
VNTLGWSSLRPLQQEAIGPLRSGSHALLLAPTAGGKTEAVFFPLLSRMLDEDWGGLSVLYVCPLRALLNDLHQRLERFAVLVGRRVGVWHGDVGEPARRLIREDPPDVLLTTPESLEAMLVSTKTDEHDLFGNVRVAVVDEIHAFAGDDRGWHLLAVLTRLERLSAHPLQRVGLSATVGNPDELLEWLTRAGSEGSRQVINPEAASEGAPADLTVDYVATLDNAATVIARLHRGEKRLVFADSRARVEQLGHELGRLGVTTFLSHGSLGRDERCRAEAAFAQERDCVIVATSTLELGIDIGDLDRVIQIDAPSSVSGFLQRLGRSGRRTGTSRNMLFLATDEDALLEALGLLRLFEQGFVEPLEPPALPLHLVAQQALAIVLQEGGVGRHTLLERLGDPFVFGDEVRAHAEGILDHLVEAGWLHDDGGLLSIGPESEQQFGRRHFLELLSVFSSPPEFAVLWGQKELGTVPESAFMIAEEKQRVILLAGQSWFVRSIDWDRKTVTVEPSDQRGVASWFGATRALPAELCRSIREVLCGDLPEQVHLSRRAADRLDRVQKEFAWLRAGETVLAPGPDGSMRWWTFSGLLANLWLAEALQGLREADGARHNLRLRLPAEVGSSEVCEALAVVDFDELVIAEQISRAGLQRIKFAECLPEEVAMRVLERRFDARADARQTADEIIHELRDQVL